MYDDVRTLFGRTLPAGTQVRFEIANPSIPVTLNVADFEEVAPPAPQPRGSISVLSYGADPTGQTDSTTAIQNAINAGSAAGKAVYIPPGNFLVTSHLIVNNVTLTGAGEWYSVLGGNGVGVFGNFAPAPSTNVHLSNFAISGQVNARVDSEDFMGIGGSLQNSTISSVWIEHVQAGIWMTGPFTNLKISNVRIQDTVADGINFDGGITDSSVTNTYIRNTGDDGIALWSNGVADANDTISNDTVQLPVLANNFAIYGGSDNSITHDYGTDTITQGGGIQVGNRFSAVPLAGTTTIADNTLVRTGTLDPNWKFGVGAIWFYASDGENMTGTINVDDNTILDSPYDAFGFVGDYIPNATPPAYAITTSTSTTTSSATSARSCAQLQSAGSTPRSPRRRLRSSGLDGTMACGYGITLTHGTGQQRLERLGVHVPAVQHPQHVDLVGGLRAGQPQHPEPRPDGHHHQPGTRPGADLVASTRPAGSPRPTTARRRSPSAPAARPRSPSRPRPCSSTRACLVFDANPLNNPFAPYVVSLSAAVYNPNGNLGLTATASADNTLAGFPASNANDGNQATYWQAANSTGVLTLQLAKAAPVDRVVLELPQGWGDRDQTIEVDGSTDGTTWTQLVAPAAYLFSASNAAGNNVVSIPVPSTTVNYIRVDVSNNTVQGAPQIAEFQVYSN